MGGKRRRQAPTPDDLAAEQAVAELEQPQAEELKKKKKLKQRNAVAAGLKEDRDGGADRATGNGLKTSKKMKKEAGVNEGAVAPAPANGIAHAENAENSEPVEKPVGLQIYWNLSLRNEKAREEASVALVNELRDAQQVWDETAKNGQQAAEEVLLGAATDDVLLAGCAPAVRYALCRLVRGLSSSRDTVRQGFAAALAAVLGALACVDGEAIMKLANKNLEVASSMKGQEARDVLIGRLFAYGALMRGFKGKTKALELAKEITQQLLSLAAEKRFLREPSVSLLLEFAEPLSSEFLRKSVFSAPLFQEWIQAKLDDASPEGLWLVLILHQKLPAAMRESCAMLAGLDDLKQVLEPAHLSSLVPILKETTCSHPRVHSVWPVFLQLLLSGKNVGATDRKRKKKTAANVGHDWEVILRNFWEVVVEKSLLTSSHERKHLAMELLLLLLPNLGPSSVRVVLTRPLVRCLSDVLSGEQSLLHKSAQRCLQEICLWAQQEDERIVAVIMSLQECSLGKFDLNSNTKTVRTLTSKLSGEKSCRSLITSLFQHFLQGSPQGKQHEGDNTVTGRKVDVDTHELHSNGDTVQVQDAGEVELTTQDQSATDLAKIWVLDQLFLVFKVVQLEPLVRASLQKDVLRFLALHGLFDAGPHFQGMKTHLGETLEWPQEPLSDRLRKICVARLSTFLVDAQRSISSQSTSQKNQESEAAGHPQPSQAEDFAAFVVEFLDRVHKLNTISFVQTVSEDDRKSLTDLHAALVQVTQALSTCDKESSAKLKAMRSFLIQLLFQLYVEPGALTDVVAELLLCCQYLFGQLFEVPLAVAEPDQNEFPNNMDVLVDILLSVLIQPSARIRAAAEQVFRVFCGDLTPVGLQAILRVVKKQPTARHKPAFKVDEESDEDEAVGVDDDSDGDEGGEEAEGESDGDVEDDDGEDVESDDDEGDDEEDDQDGTTDGLKVDKLTGKKQVTDETHAGVVKANAVVKPQATVRTNKSDSDDEDEDENLSDMDDEQMFKMDVHLSKILQQRKGGGDGSQNNKDVQNQLTDFKLRALSLLEIFVQKHPSSPLVLTVLPALLQQVVITSVEEGSSQLTGRILNIIQSKILKGKQYPKGSDLSLSSVKELLQKTINLAARSTNKKVGKIAQLSVLWLLKVIHGNWSGSELQNDTALRQMFADSLRDFFLKKKCRLPVTFFSDILTRYPWQGEFLVTILLEQSKSARTEFLQSQALQLVSGFLRTKGGKQQSSAPTAVGSLSAVLEPHLKLLGEVIVAVFQKPPTKASTRKEALGYCISCLQSLPKVYSKVRLVDVVDVPVLLAAMKALGLPKLKKLEGILEGSLGDIQQNGRDQPVTGSVLKKSKRKELQKDVDSKGNVENHGHENGLISSDREAKKAKRSKKVAGSKG